MTNARRITAREAERRLRPLVDEKGVDEVARLLKISPRTFYSWRLNPDRRLHPKKTQAVRALTPKETVPQ